MKFGRPFWITVAVLLIATAIYYPFSPGGSQAWSIKRAERHIETLKPLIASDPRFAKIRLGTGTSHGGCLTVLGEVASEEDAESLRAIVTSSHPPTEVFFRPRVQPTSEPTSLPAGIP